LAILAIFTEGSDCWYIAVDTLSTLLGSLFSFNSSCSTGVRTWSPTVTPGVFDVPQHCF